MAKPFISSLTELIPLSSEASNFITINVLFLPYNFFAIAKIVDVLPVPDVPWNNICGKEPADIILLRHPIILS